MDLSNKNEEEKDILESVEEKEEELNNHSDKEGDTEGEKDETIEEVAIETESSPEEKVSDPALKNSSKSNFVLGIAAGVLTIAVIAIAIFALGIYSFRWNNALVYKVTKVIPYPIAFVNNSSIRFSAYLDDMETLRNFINHQGGEETSGLEERVLDRLIQNKVAEQLAKKYDVKVTKEDLEAEVQKIVDQEGSMEAVEGILEEQYGWGVEKFKAKVLEPFLLQDKLQEAIAGDNELNKEAREKIEDILEKINDGEEIFEDLAKEYGEDGTASEGGSLGVFGKGEMVKEFEEAAFALEKGEVSEVVSTKYGYHVIKVENVIKNDEGEVEQVEAKHILIRTKSFDEFLEEKIEEAKVWKMIKL